MRRIFFALALVVVAGCPGSPKSGGDGGGGGNGDLVTSGPADLAPRGIAGIACGASTCTTTLELCCTGSYAVDGDCQTIQNPSCGDAEFLCDGPEDCEPANPVCCVQGGYAACRPDGYCPVAMGARIMCHQKSDCGASEECLGAPNGSPYALCLTPQP
jgi:hypothetical protein